MLKSSTALLCLNDCRPSRPGSSDLWTAGMVKCPWLALSVFASLKAMGNVQSKWHSCDPFPTPLTFEGLGLGL